jgi:hypothetical protein
LLVCWGWVWGLHFYIGYFHKEKEKGKKEKTLVMIANLRTVLRTTPEQHRSPHNQLPCLLHDCTYIDIPV